ncbi:MAG: M14 family zinc carboxypeptidase [Gemmatimonadales bacterium]|jgi:hypothetical protein
MPLNTIPIVHHTDQILSTQALDLGAGERIGRSRGGQAIRAFRLGHGPRRISLLAGSHADEPVGPRLLRRVAGYLSARAADDPLLSEYEWWIVPQINPDGAERNRAWQHEAADAYTLCDYLVNVVREPPGDDIEFGFPRDAGDREARPENLAVHDWWHRADGPFSLHVSLHGMAFAAGPWFLIEPAWHDRFGRIREICVAAVAELGYTLHDAERRGEKGFFRLERGFCTRPDSRYMREHFIALGEPDTAALFRPSSMEAVRALGGDPLTLVSEMPLFITPGVGESLGPPDPAAERWRQLLEGWRAELRGGATAAEVAAAARTRGLQAMPVRDQMALQWTFIAAGLEQIRVLDR